MRTNSVPSLLSSAVILSHITELTLQIQHGWDLAAIIQGAIATLRMNLQVDRVLVYRWGAEQEVIVTFESLAPGWLPLLGQKLASSDWADLWRSPDQPHDGSSLTATATTHVNLQAQASRDIPKKLQVQASLVVPIVGAGTIYGVLALHQCRSPREWQSLEVQYLEQIALQLGIASQRTVGYSPNQYPDFNLCYLADDVTSTQTGFPSANQRPDRPFTPADLAPVVNKSPDCQHTPRHPAFQAALLRSMADANPQALYAVDHATDQVLYLNHPFCQIWGLEDLEAQLQAGELQHSDLVTRCLALVQNEAAYLAVCEQMQDATNQATVEHEIEFIDGRIIRCFSRGLPPAPDHGLGRLYIFEDISDRKRRETLIHHIAQGLSATTGEIFFRSLVSYLTRSLNIEHAFVGEVVGGSRDRIRVLAGLSLGQPLDGFEYALASTPCEEVIHRGGAFYSEKLQQQFPDDVVLQQIGGEGCIGTRLVSSNGTVNGILCVISNRPITNGQLIRDVLNIFATRTASELERQQADAKLSRYERIFSANPDCVAVIDCDYIYQVVNPTYLTWNQKAYDEIVGYSVRDLLGQTFFERYSKPLLDRCLLDGQQQVLETWQQHADGKRRFVRATYSPYVELDGSISGIVIHVHDLTNLKLVEEALRDSEERFRQMATTIQEVFWMADVDFTEMIYISPVYETIWGRSCESLYHNPHSFLESIHPDDRAEAIAIMEQQRLSGFSHEYRLLRPDGTIRWIWERAFPVLDAAGQPYRLVGVSQDITDRKLAEIALQQQAERQALLSEVAQHIRQTLDLDLILQTTVTDVRQFMQTDRVIIYRFNPDWSGVIIAESVAEGWNSILGMQITDTYFVENQGQPYEQGRIKATDDIYRNQLDPCHVALLEHMQVRAKLVVPILQENHLWGLLVAQHCRSPRHWEDWEIELQQQLATQIAIALQQAHLYRQSQLELAERQRAEAALTQLNQELEQRVQERTQALQQQAEQERLLRLIIQHIHQSLDLEDVLATVLRETRQTFHADRVSLYQFQPDWSGHFVAESVREGCLPLVSPTVQPVWEDTYLQETHGGRFREHQTLAVADIYAVGHTECHIDLLEQFQVRAYAIAPIFMDDKLWGLLSIYQNTEPRAWQDWEIRLLQQIAIQTAIALRQSQLYQASQAQVKELERLSQLKDDFLSTVSHELRSPMSSIKMATQMLEISLNRLGILDDPTAPINRYFRVLQEEGQREINLINDLLDLARLDAGTETLTFTNVDLQVCVPYLAQSFMERARQQQQQFQVNIPATLPPLTTDQTYLERILTELMHNACKYTPAGETITVSAQLHQDFIEIRISNTGVEISPAECDRIFEKFYRIPKNDPWKHGGTGLGLALVKKLIERLAGTIQIESQDGQTSFILQFQRSPLEHAVPPR